MDTQRSFSSLLAKSAVAALSFRCSRFFSTTALALATWRSELRSSFWRFGEGGCNGTMAPSPMPSMCRNTFDNNNSDNNNNHHNNTNNNTQ